MADKKLVIADGHHRYETALAFRDEKRREIGLDDAGAFEWLMTTSVNMESPGMTVLPTHRVVRSLPSYDVERFLKQARQYFDVSEVDDAESLENRLKEGGARHPTVGVATEGRERLMLLELRDGLDMRAILPDVSSKQAGLDVVILHRLIFKKCMGISEEDVREGSYLRYVRGLDVAVREVRDGRAQVLLPAEPDARGAGSRHRVCWGSSASEID